MDAMQKGILTLIRSALTEEKLPLPDGFDLGQAYPLIRCHQIEALAYDGAVRCGIPKDLPIMGQLFGRYCRLLLRSEQQMREVEKLCQAFDASGIAYMPLKGCNLKKLYPKPELRQMGDADILIRTEQYERIRPIMQNLGYQELQESDHELIWKSSALLVELHKRLIPSYNKDYYRYFGDGWQLAEHSDGCRYSMSPEDTLIYLFTHFAKHYRDGGIGIRHVADLWVYLDSQPDLKEPYIEKELTKLRLLEFYKNVRKLIELWFGDACADEKTLFLSCTVFDSGSWGSRENHASSVGVKLSKASGSVKFGAFKRWLKVFFPDLSSMQQMYPILVKAPALLPALWLYRFLDVLFSRRKNIRKQLNYLTMITPDQIENYQQALSYVGLDFHFKD